MDFERDIIHEYIQPKLNVEALSYGENVEFCDLRWGVDTVGMDIIDSSKKVLDVCFDEIDNCRPYMVVLLGNRYGWIPDSKTYTAIVENRFTFVDDMIEKSITELEIKYGALSKGQLSKVFFYFRNFEGDIPEEYKCENEESEKKLNELKKNILAMSGSNVKTYSVKWDRQSKILKGIDEFKALLFKDLRKALQNDWEKYLKLSEFDKNQRQHWNYARQKNTEFYGRQHVVDELMLHIKNKQILEISGEVGSGKSCIMGHLAFELGKEGYIVLPIFCGLTPSCSTTSGLVQYMVHYFEKAVFCNVFSEHIEDNEDSLKKLHNYYVAYQNTGKRLVILIDAIDQLTDNERNDLRFLPRSSMFNIKVVISHSMTSGFKSNDQYILGKLNKSDIVGIIKNNLKMKSKELNNEVIELIQQKKNSNNPLYLRMIIQRLLMFNKNDFEKIRDIDSTINGIHVYGLGLVRDFPEELEAACQEMIKKIVSHNREFYELVLNILFLSRYGLRETDIEHIVEGKKLKWNRLDFAQMMNYMWEFIIIREDGRYDFAHKCFRTSVSVSDEKKYLIHKSLISHFNALDILDPVKQLELPYHCFKAHNTDVLMLYIKDVIDAYEDVDNELINENILNIISSNIYEMMVQDTLGMMQDVCDMALEDERLYEQVSKFINHFMIKRLGYVEEQILPMYYLLLEQMKVMQKSIRIYLDTDIVYYIEHKFKSIYFDSKVPSRINKNNVILVHTIVSIISDIYLNISKCLDRLTGDYYDVALELNVRAIMLLEIIKDAGFSIGIEYYDDTNTRLMIQLSKHYECLAHYYVVRNDVIDGIKAKKLLNQAVNINFSLLNNIDTRREIYYNRLTETYLKVCELLISNDLDKKELKYAYIIAEKCLHVRRDMLHDKKGEIEVLLMLSKISAVRQDVIRAFAFAKYYFIGCEHLLDGEKKYENYINLVSAYRWLIELSCKYGNKIDNSMIKNQKKELDKFEAWVNSLYSVLLKDMEVKIAEVSIDIPLSVPSADDIYWNNKKKSTIIKKTLFWEKIIVLFSLTGCLCIIHRLKTNRVDFSKIDFAIEMIIFFLCLMCVAILVWALTNLYETRNYNYYIEKLKDTVDPD